MIGTVMYYYYNDAPSDATSDVVWEAWTFFADPGTHAYLEENDVRAVGFIIAFMGIVYFSVVTGFVVDAVREKMTVLKMGLSPVVEEGHIVILGWTDKTPPIIRQLCISMESERGGVIVILTHEDRDIVEQELAHHFPKSELRGSRVIYRRGNPLLSSDLMMVSAFAARAVILLSPPGDVSAADSKVLRMVLSLKSMPYEMRGYAVAELRDSDNDPLITMVGQEMLETVVLNEFIGRLMVMGIHQPGIIHVYEHLLGFDGNEFYSSVWEGVTGKTFGEVLFCFPDAIPIGVRFPGEPIFLNPPSELTIRRGMEIVVIAEDDDSYMPYKPYPISIDPPPKKLERNPSSDKYLIIGWRKDIDDLLLLLDVMAPHGTEVTFFAQTPLDEREHVLNEDGLELSMFRNITHIIHEEGLPVVRRRLELLPVEKYDAIMLLSADSDDGHVDSLSSDSSCLTCLLLLFDILNTRTKQYMEKKLRPRKPRALNLPRWKNLLEQVRIRNPDMVAISSSDVSDTPVICEILDSRTRHLLEHNVEVANKSDFLLTNEIFSKVLAMVAENRAVKAVVDELTGYKGCVVNVESAMDYAYPKEPLNFWEMMARVRARGGICMGYKLDTDAAPTLNPTDKEEVIFWGSKDAVILLTPPREKSEERDRLFRNMTTAQKKLKPIKPRPEDDKSTIASGR
eukprot:Rmarinus@m.18522